MLGPLNLQPRFYQTECHDAIFRDLETKRSTVVALATGSGKSMVAIMAAHTVVKNGGKVLYTAARNELIDQPVDKMMAALGIRPAVEKAEHRAKLNAPIVIASLQSLASKRGDYGRLRRFPPNHFDLIINDEADTNVEQAKAISDHFTGAKVVGMTATAWRANRPDLGEWYQGLAYELPAFGTKGLIEHGFLTPVHPMTLDIEIDLRNVRQRDGDYDAEQLGNVMAPLMRRVAQAIKAHPILSTRQIVAYLPLIQSSKDFMRICREEGLAAEHCDGTTPNRGEVMAAFELGHFTILTNSQLYSRGVDFLRANCFLNLSPTRSHSLYRQRLGRFLRTLPGVIDHLPGEHQAEERRAAIAASAKPDSIVCDLLAQFGRLGLADPASLVTNDPEEQKQLRERLRTQRTPAELEEIRREVQKDREQKVIDELRRQQARRERQQQARRWKFSRFKGQSYESVPLRFLEWCHAQREKPWARNFPDEMAYAAQRVEGARRMQEMKEELFDIKGVLKH